MRRLIHASTVAVALALVAPAFLGAQGMNQDRVVPGGGITAPGWKAKLDASSIAQGRTANDSKFVMAGTTITMNVGPAAVYWNPANTASGDYTISATFSEPTWQTVNDHPHNYGIFIGGNKLDSDQMSLLYCTPYGNGTFIVRGFTSPQPPARAGGPPVTTFRPAAGGRAGANAAINKAEAIGKPVSNAVAFSVKGDKVSCMINGTEVWTSPKTDLIGTGKLESTDGVYGLRVSHNVDVIVTNWKKS